jgi:PAS domain S-box-containing protein
MDADETRRRHLLTVMLVAVALSAALVLVILPFTTALGIAGERSELQLLTVAGLVTLLGAGALMLINRYVSVDLAAALFVLMLLALAAFFDSPQEVIDGRGLLVFALPVVAASVLLRPWASFLAAALSSAVITGIGWFVVGQPVPNVPAILELLLLALVSWLSARNLAQTLKSLEATNNRLKRSEAQYHGIIDASRDAILVLNTDGVIVETNPAADTLFGYAPGELRQMEMTALIHPDDRETFDAMVNRISTGTDLRIESLALRRDDSPLDVEARLTTFEYQGHPHLLTMVRDISERKAIDRAVQERMKELTCLYAVSRDVQEDIAVEALCQRIIGHLHRAVKYPEIAIPVIALDGQRFATGAIDGNAVRTIHAEIKVREVTRGHVSVTYVEDAPFLIPEEQKLLNSIAEILGQRLLRQRVERQRRIAHHALQDQLARVELLNQITRAMAARYDPDSILRVVAQRLEEGFTDLASVWLRKDNDHHFTLAAVGDRGRQAVDPPALISPLSIPDPIGDDLMQGELRYWPDLTTLDAPDVTAFVEPLGIRAVVMAPLVAGGEMMGILVTARREPNAFERQERDFLQNLAVHVGLILRQARLRQEIQEAYDDLRQTQLAVMQQERLQALGQMASGIAHDINNAIAPVPLYLGMMRRDADLSPKMMSHLRAIETAIGDVKGTVTRMRAFYRRSEWGEDLSSVNLNEVLTEAIELTRPRWRDVPQQHGITIDLETDFEESLPPIAGLEGEIRQAVTNLIFNAVDAMPEGGTLTLRTRKRTAPPPHIMLEVSDTGIGMDDETRQRCLEPFFTTKGDQGSGMGLATVYGTMQRHNGDVSVETALGAGTTVRLSFPVHEVTGVEDPSQGVVPPRSLRILFIDDEPLLRQALKETLGGEGHTVTTADGGQSGLEAFQAALQHEHPFDVVITDLGMPYIDGRDVAQAVKAERPETPVILLTGWGISLDTDDDLPEGVDLMLGKPPMIDTLIRALAQVTPRQGPGT